MARFTRSFRLQSNQPLRPFDLNPFHSNRDRLPPPDQSIPKLSRTAPCTQPPSPSMSSSSDDPRRDGSSPQADRLNPRPSPPPPVEDEDENKSLADHCVRLTTRDTCKKKHPEDFRCQEFPEKSCLKSDGSNYIPWKCLQLLVMQNNKWEHYLFGLVPCPDVTESVNDYETWCQIDSLVLNQLAFNMDGDLFAEIFSDDMTSTLLWNAILNRFEEHSDLAQDTTRNKLCSKRIQEGKSMKDHIVSLRKLKADYYNVGGILSRSQWHSIIVSSLDGHTQWGHMDLYVDSIEDPETLIKKLELKELRRFGLTKKPEAVLQTKQDGRPKRNPALVCQNCNCRGHSQPDCYAPEGDATHRRPPGYHPLLHMLDKEHAALVSQLQAIDTQISNASALLVKLSSNEIARITSVPPDTARQFALIAVQHSDITPHSWLLDSGVFSHMLNCRENFSDYRDIAPVDIYTAKKDSILQAVGIGTINVLFQTDDGTSPAQIFNVLHVPNLAHNLLSLAKLDQRGIHVNFANGRCHLFSAQKCITQGSSVDNQWVINMALTQPIHAQLVSSLADSRQPLHVWHFHLGHLNPQHIIHLDAQNCVDGMQLADQDATGRCSTCLTAKMPAQPTPARPLCASAPGDIVHADLEFIGHKSFSGADISLKFIDEFSNFVWVYAIKSKSADTILAAWKSLVAHFLTQFSICVKALHTDNGTEFTNATMQHFNDENGIQHHLTAPHQHKMNGRAERLNHTGADSVRAMLQYADLPNIYWAEAYDTFAYIHNRVAHTAIPHQTPYQVLYKRKPSISHLRIFGSLAYTCILPDEHKKLDSKAVPLRLIGYHNDAAYCLINPRTCQITYSRDVVFDEHQLAICPASAPSQPHHDQASTKALTRPSRNSKPTSQQLDSSEQQQSLSYLDDNPTDAQLVQTASQHHVVAGIPIPRSATEAFRSHQADKWTSAMAYEVSKLTKMDCWDVIEHPDDLHIIKGMWVFNLKEDADGSLEYQARWVACSDSRVPRLEFGETFTSTGDFITACIVMAISAHPQAGLVTIDINSAYLHSPLQEPDLVIEYLTSFTVPNLHQPCCLLKKALYGLCQGACAWNLHFASKLRDLGFKHCKTAPTTFYRSTSEGETILATHVDDVQGACKSTQGPRDAECLKFKLDVGNLFKFKEKDTCHTTNVLGLTVAYDENNGTVKISVPFKIDSALQRYGLKDAKPAKLPMLTNALHNFEQDNSDSFDKPPWPYTQLIGELLWIGNVARPDIAFAVNTLAKFLCLPKDTHWEAAKRVLRYLKGTRDLGIVYRSGGDEIPIAYSDSDWGGDVRDCKSMTGFVFLFNGGPVIWRSKKQNVVATSTAEAEYLAVSSAINEVKWLRSFLSEIDRELEAPLAIFVDNMAAIQMTKDPVFQNRTKHIDMHAHHVRDEVYRNSVALKHISRDLNPADVLTKPLSPILHEKCVCLLGMT